MISAVNQELLQNAIEAVRQRREAARSEAQQLAAKTALKPSARAGAKKKPSAKPAKTPQSTVTPYLTAADLQQAGDRVAEAENTDAAAQRSYTEAAANAGLASGDVERARVANVSNANNDAAARGIFKSGIRRGNVGLAETDAARGQSRIQGGLSLASAAATQQRNAAKQQLATFMQTVAARAAENGAALPVDPYDNGAANVKGAATLRRRAKR